MKKCFKLIIPILFFCISAFSYVKVNAADIQPYNMLSNNQSGTGQQYIDNLRLRIANNFQGYYQSTYSWINDVPDDQIVVVFGDTLYGSYQDVYQVLVPMEYYNQSSSSIVCSSYTYTDDTVDSVTINFVNYVKFWIGHGDYSDNPYYGGAKTYSFDSSDSYQLVYCYKPIYCNEVLVVDTTDDIEIPIVPSLPGIGSMGSGGHSSSISPFDEISSNAHSWHGISGSVSSSGHSVNLPTSTPAFDFSQAEQNLLGQILNNTDTLIGHSSAIYEGLKNINDNLINGVSSVYNGISASIINFNSFYAYISEPYAADEIVDYLEDSDFYSYRSDLESYFEDFNSNIDTIKSGILSTETQELVIPIDFHSWFIVTEDYGTISPYNATHYMRFPFLDETKALWQPLLIAFLYLSLIIGLFFDSPAIVRGVMNT